MTAQETILKAVDQEGINLLTCEPATIVDLRRAERQGLVQFKYFKVVLTGKGKQTIN